MATIVIKQFRTETESKYVLSSPTESEQELSKESLLQHQAPTHQILQPQEQQPRLRHPQDQRSHENHLTEVSPEGRTSDVLPSLVQSSTTQSPLAQDESTRSFNNKYTRYKPSESDKSSEPPQLKTDGLPTESGRKDEEFLEPTVEKSVETVEGERGNEDYHSDDDDVLLKVSF